MLERNTCKEKIKRDMREVTVDTKSSRLIVHLRLGLNKVCINKRCNFNSILRDNERKSH